MSAVGFIGVGRMGGGMARRLCGDGHTVTVFDPSPAATEACRAAGAQVAADAATAVAGADAVFTSLPMPEHVLATYRDIAGVLRPDAVCVDVSTIDPATARAVADLLPGRFVACPVGKTPAQAEAGDLPLFVGGDRSAVDTVRPLLRCIGATLHELGTVEAATTFKLLSNLVGMTNVAVLAEGLALARNAGIDADTFTAALQDTGAWSFQCELRLPWMLAEDHHARFAVDLAAKDLRLAVDAAARAGIPTPVGAQGLMQLLAASARGDGDQDVTAVANLVQGP